jgi:hypothetical protein
VAVLVAVGFLPPSTSVRIAGHFFGSSNMARTRVNKGRNSPPYTYIRIRCLKHPRKRQPVAPVLASASDVGGGRAESGWHTTGKFLSVLE